MQNVSPAPWKILPGYDSRVYLVDDAKGHAVGEVIFTDTRKPADAHLISAAPELLASCIELLSCIQPDRDWHEAKRARAAIAKAEGRAK